MIRSLIYLFLFLSSVNSTIAQSIYLPNDTSCVINVKMPPFNAVGNGFVDDTEAIQQAIYASIAGENSKVVYFPEGTYLVSQPIEVSLPNGIATPVGPWLKGENQYTSVIKIEDDNPAFVTGIDDEYIGVLEVPCFNPLTPLTGHKSIENIGVYIGNNEDACGIKMCGQSNILKNVRVKGKGVGAGIVLGNENISSNALVLQSTVKDTDVGYYCTNDLSNYTFSEIIGIGLNTSIKLKEAMACIDNFVSLETKRIGIEALDTLTNFSILNSTIEFTDEAKSFGDVFSYHNFYARNVYLVNPPTLNATSPIYGIFDNDTSRIEELYTAPIFKSQDTDYEGMLRIPIKTPERIVLDNNLDNWVSVADFGADPTDNLDDSEAIQAAFDYAADNGKTTVYFPGCGILNGEAYRLINQYISVRGTVRKVIGLGFANFLGNGFIVEQNVQDVISFSHLYGLDINQPLSFENYDVNKISVFEDLAGIVLTTGSGTSYINNLTGFFGNDNAFSTIYGRGLNNYLLDPADYSEGFITMVNQGGKFWLSGIRAEHPYSILASMAGGQTEVMGGLVNPNYLPDTPPLFFTSEAETTIANFKIRGLAANGGNPNYTYDLEGGVNVGNMQSSDAVIPNTIVIYSDADGQECPPDGTECEDGNPFTTDTFYKDCICEGQNVQVRVNTLLEGFYNQETGEMTTELNQARLIPNTQPFNVAPFNYNGTETDFNIPPFIVDWVLLELRNAADPNIVMFRRPAFLSIDGRVVNVEKGYTAGTVFNGLPDGEYYLAMYHKSHLPVITKEPISINSTATNYLDLTTEDLLEGFEPTTSLLGTSKKALYAGDYDQNGLINNLDYNVWVSNNSVVNDYVPQDGDGNGITNNLDYNLWIKNRSKLAPVVLHK